METLMFTGLFASIASSAVGAYAKKGVSILTMIPRPVWEALAVIGYVLALLTLHQHYAHAQIENAVKSAVAQRDTQWRAAFDKERQAAAAWKHASDLRLVQIAEQQRKLNDEENARIAADARALRLRGPGQAAATGCRPVDHSGLAAASGNAGPRPGPNERAEVPAKDGTDQWAVVPWNWLVSVVEEHDAWRADALTHQASWEALRVEWDRMRQSLATPHK